MNEKLRKNLKGHKVLVFLDFEGTQFSHEMIAIGAISVIIDPKTGRIRKRKHPFKIYVRAHNKIGAYVVELTGIDEKLLKEKGVTFDTAMKSLKKYVGIGFKNATFITYGNHDLRIINQSISYNMAYPKEITSQIQKNYFDYSAFIGEFIRDENGNALSLVHLCELFGVPMAGEAHDPAVDAINLANLYDAFIQKPGIVVEQYAKHLQKHTGNFPMPVAKVVAKLASGQDVTAKEFEEHLKKYVS